MERVDYEPMRINTILEMHRRGEINLNPWYQRRSVWTNAQKAYLINTIIDGKPIPAVYLRQTVDIEREKTLTEVVDGQQRIRSIIEFRDGQFSVRHPRSGKRVKFEDLGKEKEVFLFRQLSVAQLVHASDSDVIDIFGRINSVSKTLNSQEKRNAQFSGEFKQFCLSQASSRVEFWRDFGVFSPTQIARMQEVQFVSDLVNNLLNGLTDFSQAKLNAIYKKYDDEFQYWDKMEIKLDKVFDKIGSLGKSVFVDSIFSREPIFFSLCLLLDGKKSIKVRLLSNSMKEIDGKFGDPEVDSLRGADAEFYGAISATTQRIKQRKIREKYLSENLSL
jgi:hypothetical protein